MLWDNTLQDLFFKGGFAMYPLLACSIVGLALIVERTLVMWWLGQNFDRFVRSLGEPILRGRLDEARAWVEKSGKPLPRVAAAYLQLAAAPADLREKATQLEASKQLTRLEKRMSALAMIASIGTLLGLLGTVTGLVTAFHQIEMKSGQIQPGDLAAGIWEALITTVFGLVIAIPCMAAYHVLDNQAAAVGLRMEWLVLQLDQWLHPEAIHAKPVGTRPAPNKHDPSMGVGVR